MDYTVRGILQARILKWDLPSPEIFPTQGLNPGLLHRRWILYQPSHQGSPRTLERVVYPFTSGSSQPRNQPGSPAVQAVSLPAEPPGKPSINDSWFHIQKGNRKTIEHFILYTKLTFYFPLSSWRKLGCVAFGKLVLDFSLLFFCFQFHWYLLFMISLLMLALSLFCFSSRFLKWELTLLISDFFFFWGVYSC